jgi:hypothetical protein
MNKLKAICVTACLLVTVPFAWPQAYVNETLETAFIYVNTATGSDQNPGTVGAPLKTIGAAVALAETNNGANVGSRVIIQPGTYRESIIVSPPYKSTSMPVTIEAATNGTVNVSGAVQYTGWQVDAGNNNIYTNSWTNNWALCNTLSAGAPPAPDIVLRREMVFVDSTPLTQVLSFTEMTAGTFYVDTANETIYVWPPTGTSMSTADVEVATLPTVMQVQGQSNVVVRGLTFEYANSCRESAAVTVSSYNGSANVLLDTDNFFWNNAQGLGISSAISDFTVQNSLANHNGEAGFQVTKVASGLFQSDQSSYNNWRGAQGAYYSWNSSGAHFYQMHTLALNNFTSSYNQTHALHFDTDNASITISAMTTYGDMLSSVMAEKNEGPINITGSTLCASSALEGYNGEAGLTIRDSENVSFTGGYLVNNNFGVGVTGVAGGFPETNWQTGEDYQLVNMYVTLQSNVIEGVAGQNLFNDSTLNGTDWTDFDSTLSSNHNTWWDPATTDVFVVPVPNQGTVEDFAGWQSTTGQDTNSVWQQPTGNPGAACSSAVDANDFWFIIPNESSILTISPQTSAVFAATMVPLGTFNGTAQLSFDGVQNIPGGATGSWSASSVSPNQTATFTVTPGPKTPSGTYPVVMIASSGSVTRTITAFVVIDTTIKLSTTSLDFGDQLKNTTSAPLSTTLTNEGSVALSITSITVTGPNTQDFAESNNCGTSLAASSSCTITLTFTPGNTGSGTATVGIDDSDATSPQDVALSGTGTDPAVTMSPTTYTFPNQAVGTVSAPELLTLTNTGTAPLTITSITVGGGNAGDFAETNPCGLTVAAGADCTISVTFDPQKTGNRSGKITVAGNSSPANTVLTLNGTGIQSGSSISPNSLGFGTQVWNTSSASKTISLTNNGTAALNISSVSVTGSNPGDFAETNTCGSSLAINASCSIDVTFTPLALNSRSASVSVTDDAPRSPQTVSLTGSGKTSLTYSPKSITFTSRVVGTTSSPRVVTLTNVGKTLSIQSVEITGTNAGDFAETKTCGSSLAANASCTVSITFTPTAGGTRTANLTITDPDPASPQVVTITGTGTTYPAVSLTPSSLTFASQDAGTSSPPQAVTLKNTGGASLSISSIAPTGHDADDFTETNNCGSSVAAGASCVINVVFSPASKGTLTASIKITDNATPATQTVSLTATGTQPGGSVSPGSLSFGSQVWKVTTATQTVTLANTGTATLDISDVTIEGSNPGDFAETKTCGSTLAAGLSCTISVTFTPKETGARTASLSVTDNAPNSPQTVNFNGTGATSVSYSPKTLGFGSHKVGTSSSPSDVTVTNLGNALSIQSITITGTNAGDFTETNTCGASLAANASCSVSVTFTPQATGSRSATLNLNDSDPTSPQQVTLTGSGE